MPLLVTMVQLLVSPTVGPLDFIERWDTDRIGEGQAIGLVGNHREPRDERGGDTLEHMDGCGRQGGGAEPHPTAVGEQGAQGRRRDLAAAVLGASNPGRGRYERACAVLLVQSGEARACRTAGGLAVFVSAPRYREGAVRGVR